MFVPPKQDTDESSRVHDSATDKSDKRRTNGDPKENKRADIIPNTNNSNEKVWTKT